MAQFRGLVEGTRGEATRLGSKVSGLVTECNGWRSGVKVYASFNTTTGLDDFHIYLTDGSAHAAMDRLLAVVRGQDVEIEQLTADGRRSCGNSIKS